MEVFMNFRNKNIVLMMLLAIVPCKVRSLGFVDTCSSIGQGASLIATAADFTGYRDQVPPIINSASTMYGIGSLGYLAYRLCYGVTPKSEPENALGTMSKAFSDISTIKMWCGLGYILTPNSVKWAIGNAIPQNVKDTYAKTKQFVDDHRVIKAVALATYVAYKFSQKSDVSNSLQVVVPISPVVSPISSTGAAFDGSCSDMMQHAMALVL